MIAKWASSVAIDTVKKAEDADAFIIRLDEPHDKRQTTIFSFVIRLWKFWK